MTQASINNATYDASTGILIVNGENFSATGGAANDVDVTKLIFSNAIGGNHTLTSDNVEITSSTQFTVQLNSADRTVLLQSIITENSSNYLVEGLAGFIFDQPTIGDTLSNIVTVTNYTPNSAPQGSVTITGTPELGEELLASNTLSDADGLGTIVYSWKRDGVTISGANSSAYTLVQADVGSSISVTASYTDGHGVNESVSSIATSPVVAALDPTITFDGVTEIDEYGNGLVDITLSNYDPNGEYLFKFGQFDSGDILFYAPGSNVQIGGAFVFSSNLSNFDGSPVTLQIKLGSTGDSDNFDDQIVTSNWTLEDFPVSSAPAIDSGSFSLTVNNTDVRPDPSFTITYTETVNDGDVVPVGDGVSVTGTDLVPGEEYTFRLMVGVGDTFIPYSVDTDQGKVNTFTLTSDNPTFTESEYSFGELADDVESQGYSFYLQRVELSTTLPDGTVVENPVYVPTSEQFTGVGLDETTPVEFTVVNDEYVPPVFSGGGGSSSSDPVTPETDIDLSDVVPEPGVEVVSEPKVEVITEPEVEVVPEPEVEVIHGVEPQWNLPTKTNLKGGDVEEFSLVGEEDLITGTGNVRGSRESDLLRTFNEDDKLFGRAGDDYLRAGGGDDLLRGGRGDDVLIGNKGDDTFRDGRGDDYLILGGGDDVVYLGSGDNFIADFNDRHDSLIAKGGIEWDGNVGSYGNGTVTLV